MLLSCIFEQFFCVVRMDFKQGGGQISYVESIIRSTRVRSTRGTMSLDGSPKRKQKQFMENFPKFCLSRNGAYTTQSLQF